MKTIRKITIYFKDSDTEFLEIIGVKSSIFTNNESIFTVRTGIDVYHIPVATILYTQEEDSYVSGY